MANANAFYASFDCPPLFHQRLFSQNWPGRWRNQRWYGFTPHITLAYIPAPPPTPGQRTYTGCVPVITVAWGDQVTISVFTRHSGDADAIRRQAGGVTVNHHKEDLWNSEEVFPGQEDTTPVAENWTNGNNRCAEPEPEPVCK